MIQSDNINELLSALADAQSELPTMPKSAKAYGYMYTDLDTIVQTIKPILHRHGLGYTQSVGGVSADGMTLTTRLFSKSGQYIEDTAAIPVITGAKVNAAQTLGMGITYMRRYMLCAMLGITSDEDVDANVPQQTAQRNAPQAPQQKAGNAKVKQPAPPAPAKAQFQPKGGESTPEELARIKELCAARYANGTPVFTREEVMLYSGYRKEKTAAELIAFIENALRNRRADAPELEAADSVSKEAESGASEAFDRQPPAFEQKEIF